MESIYEVETRFYFKNKEEAYAILPFLDSSLDIKIEWNTFHYSLELFKKDIILRLNDSLINNERVLSLGYKEEDIGEFLNIRKEYTEVINNGIENSEILSILGGRVSLNTADKVKKELNRLGHKEFMSFNGNSIIGKYEPLDLDFKLMYCSSLKYPLLLEVEKEAKKLENIEKCRNEIIDFISKYKLENRIVKKEPPTLLYELLS